MEQAGENFEPGNKPQPSTPPAGGSALQNPPALKALKTIKPGAVPALKHRLKTAPKQTSACKEQAADGDASLAALGYSDQVLWRMAAKLPKDVSRILSDEVGDPQGSPGYMSVKEFVSSQSASQQEAQETYNRGRKDQSFRSESRRIKGPAKDRPGTDSSGTYQD